MYLGEDDILLLWCRAKHDEVVVLYSLAISWSLSSSLSSSDPARSTHSFVVGIVVSDFFGQSDELRELFIRQEQSEQQICEASNVAKAYVNFRCLQSQSNFPQRTI